MRAALDAPPRARVLGASVPGAAHVRRGEGCQDAHAVRVTADGWLVVAVADGMGSAVWAALGARAATLAAASATAAFVGAAPDAPLPHVVAHGLACARTALVAIGGTLGDLACTLSVTAVSPARESCVAHIGDGAVVVESDGLQVLSLPAPSEYLEVTDPLTALDWHRRVRVSEVVRDVRAVLAFTDGLQHAALTARGEPGEAFLAPLIDFARSSDDEGLASEELAALLAGPKVGEHSDDDKTLVIAVP